MADLKRWAKEMLPVEKLRALFWAQIHMRQALDGSRHALGLHDISTELRDCIYAGIVVSYTRSFGENSGLSAVGPEFRRFPGKKHEMLHEALLQARDTIYAHRDMLKLGTHLFMGMPAEELKKIRIHISSTGKGHWTIQGPSFRPHHLQDIEELCDFQMKRFHEASTKMLQHFCKDKAFKSGDYVLGEDFP